MIDEIEEVWLSHIPSFPFFMSVGDVSQFLVFDEEQFLYEVYNNLKKDIFVSVHSIEDREAESFSTVYIDLDNDDDPMLCLPDLKIILDFLREIEYDYRLYFSGNKGFAIYIDFERTHIPKFKKKLTLFIDDMIDVFNLPNLDRGVCIDPKRISRLPYTVNTKSGKLCHPINTDICVSDLNIDRVGFTSSIVKIKKSTLNREFPAILIEAVLPVEPVLPNRVNVNQADELHYLLQYAKNLISGVRHHAVRLKIIPTMIKMGHNDSWIHKICEEYWIDVFNNPPSHSDLGWIDAQIRGCRSKNIHPIHLDNLRKNYGIKGNIGL